MNAPRALTLVLVLACAAGAEAATRWVAGFETASHTRIVADPGRDRLYALDTARRELAIIDTISDRQLVRVSFPYTIQDLALSRDGRLAMAGPNEIVTYDVRTTQRRVIPVPPYVGQSPDERLVSLTWDAYGRIWAATSYLAQWGRFCRVDPTGALPQRWYSGGPGLNDSIYRPRVRTDAAGTTLICAEQGLTSETLSRYDVSGTEPRFVAETAHGEVHGHHDILVMGPDRTIVGTYWGFLVFDANFVKQESVSFTGAASAAGLARRGDQLLVASQSELMIYRGTELESTIPLMQEPAAPGGLVLARTGRKAYVATDSKPARIRVVDLPAAR